MRKLALLLAALLVVALISGLAGCGGNNVPRSASSTRPTGPTPPAATTPAGTP
ncbi:MAG: hypothetical protein AB1778_09235 [Candidatus Bipolaricaulota bacterium]